MNAPRIVSLLPSATEIVGALGAAGQLVGRSHECDTPEEVASLPVLTRTRLDGEAPSGEIDRGVRALIENALSIYVVDGAKLKDLAPDVILTQSQCEVCAVSLDDVEKALADWTGKRPKIVSLEPHALGDVASDIFRVANAIKRADQGMELLKTIERGFDSIVARTAELDDRPRIGVIEWIDPLIGGGHWLPELVEMAGGISVTGRAGQPSAKISMDELAVRDPDIIMVSPCGFDLARIRKEMASLMAMPGWKDLRAVQTRQVFMIDGKALMNRPGPRLVESLESLAEIMHRRLFVFGHRGRYWDQIPRF